MKVIGVDVGTMFMVCAEQLKDNKVEIESMRNMFLPVDDQIITISEISDTHIDFVKAKSDSGRDIMYIISEDAYKFSNIFNQPVKRPMSKGVISPEEIDAIDVLTLMVEKLIGGSTKSGYCVYSVPAASVDIEVPPVLYHEKVFGSIFTKLGYESKPINEAMSIIYSQCKNENFSGIAISFGSGLTNVACAYRGTPILTFSVSRGGDWIDQNSASSLGIVPNKVTSIKESDRMDLINPVSDKKREKRVMDAISFYYKALIDYVLKTIVNEFNKATDSLDIEESIPIIVSGGTSKPKGFIDLFKTVFSSFKDFPYDISEIRPADDPLNAVATGALIYAVWDLKKKGKLVEEVKIKKNKQEKNEETDNEGW